MTTTRSIMNLLTLVLTTTVMVAFAALPALAAPVAVSNDSFESGKTVWSSTTTAWGTRAGASGLTPTDGSLQAWVNNGCTLYQDTGEVIAEGTTYTLTVDYGPDQNNFPNIETLVIRLYGSDAGYATALAEITPTGPATTQWVTNQTASFTATAGQATGQTLGIAIGVTSGTQSEWDNVRLESTTGPVVDTDPPLLSSTSPFNGETEVLRGTELVMAFNENVTNGTGNIVIKEFAGDAVFKTIPAESDSVTISGAEVTVDPGIPFATHAGYYVLIDTNAIMDLATNYFAGITNSGAWGFTSAGIVANPSFEHGAQPAPVYNPVRWGASGSDFRPRAGVGSLTPTDGSYQAWMNNGAYGYQDTGEVIVKGWTYRQTVDVGNPSPFGDLETVVIRLYGSTLGSDTAFAELTPTVGAVDTWLLDQAVSFTATEAEAGQTLGVYLGVTSGTQAEWDNVRVTSLRTRPDGIVLIVK